MGDKIGAIFDYVRQKGMFISVMRLAMATKITRPAAHQIPETPELIEKVREAALKILDTTTIPV